LLWLGNLKCQVAYSRDHTIIHEMTGLTFLFPGFGDMWFSTKPISNTTCQTLQRLT